MEKCNKFTGELSDVPVITKLSTHNDKGEEVPDSKPASLHVNFVRPVPLGERIRKLVQNELLAREMNERGVESFEEADDFNVGDDVDPSTPFEENFDPLHTTTREQELRAGFVQEMPAERKAKSAKVIAKFKAERARYEKEFQAWRASRVKADGSDGEAGAEGVGAKA